MALRHTYKSARRSLHNLVSVVHLINVFSDHSARVAEHNAGRAKHQMRTDKYRVDGRLQSIATSDQISSIQIATAS